MLSKDSKVIMMKLKFTVLLVLILMIISCKPTPKDKFTKLEGHAFGTTFHITYEAQNDYFQANR